MTHRALTLLIVFLAGTRLLADEGPSRLPELVVTPTRMTEAGFTLPFRVDTIEEEALSGPRAPRSLPDALGEIPGVVVQKTGYGQGSPYLRGLTGFRTLILVDGIRLNHSAFRAGPNQYLATVDQLSLHHLQVIRGPASVLYGADAMGGTVNLLPREPKREDGRFLHGGRFHQRLSSAEGSSLTRIEIQGGLDGDLGILLGANRKSFGDLRAATGRLRETAYDEWDVDGRVVWHIQAETTLTVAFQRVSQVDVPRTHKTIHSRPWRGTIAGTERERNLDQDRTLLYARLNACPAGEVIDEWSATLSWHRQREVRHRLRTDGRSDRQGFTVDTFGLDLQATKEASFATVTFGLDAWIDRVDSFLTKRDAAGNITARAIQGPVANDACYELLGAFAQVEVPLGADFHLTAGARATRARARSGDVENPTTGTRTRLDESFGGLVGSAHLAWLGVDGLNLHLGASQGFRAPNLSDLTRFDTARTNEIETPATDLDPERSLTLEIGAKVDLEPVHAEISLFHTELDELIQRFPTGRTIDGLVEVTKDNVGDGAVRGIEAGVEVALGKGLSLFASGAVCYGKADAFPTSDRVKSREYLDRLMPRTGQAGLRFDPIPELSLMARIRAAAKARRLSPRDEANTERIPPGGTPGYTVLDLSAIWRICPTLTVSLALENVTDRSYRIHGSGQNESGRNLVFTLEARF